MEFKHKRLTGKEVLRSILNAYLSGDDTFIHCCRTFIKMKIQTDCFADFGLTVEEVLRLSEMKQEIQYEINSRLDTLPE